MLTNYDHLYVVDAAVLLQFPQYVSQGETLFCSWTCHKTCTCPCSCTGSQTESQGKVTGWSSVWKHPWFGIRKMLEWLHHLWGHFESRLISISPPWCSLIEARYNWSWQLKQSCPSLTKKEWKCMRRRISFTEMLFVGNV